MLLSFCASWLNYRRYASLFSLLWGRKDRLNLGLMYLIPRVGVFWQKRQWCNTPAPPWQESLTNVTMPWWTPTLWPLTTTIEHILAVTANLVWHRKEEWRRWVCVAKSRWITCNQRPFIWAQSDITHSNDFSGRFSLIGQNSWLLLQQLETYQFIPLFKCYIKGQECISSNTFHARVLN